MAEVRETDSYVSLMPPEKPENDDDEVIRLWGQFWSEQQEIYAGIYLMAEVKSRKIIELGVKAFNERKRIEGLEPDQDYDEFQQLCRESYDSDEYSASQIKMSFRQFFSSDERSDGLIDAIHEKDQEETAKIFRRLIEETVPKGGVEYRIRGGVRDLNKIDQERFLKDGSNGDGSDDFGRRETRGETDEGTEEELPKLLMQPVTKPIKGALPKHLSEGDEIFVKAHKSTKAEFKQILERRGGGTYSENSMLEGTIESIDEVPDSLPFEVENPEDYWGIEVSLPYDFLGKLFIHRETQVKEVGAEEATDEGWLGTVLITAGLVILALTAFGAYLFS